MWSEQPQTKLKFEVQVLKENGRISCREWGVGGGHWQTCPTQACRSGCFWKLGGGADCVREKSPFSPLHLLFCPQDLLSNSILPDLDIDRWYFFCLYLDLSKCPVDHLLTLGCLILGVLPEHLVN